MADLDDFFAKKDKKKLKGRKYDNPDDIAKRLVETEKKLEKELALSKEPLKKPLDDVLSTSSRPNVKTESAEGDVENGKEKVVVAAPTQIENTTNKHEEEEWKDFQDEAQKDLSNLKISKLQIEDEDDGYMGYGSGDEDGGSGSGNKSDGVWNRNIDRITAAADAEPQVIEPECPTPSSKDDSRKPGGSYIAPHLRNAMAASPMPRGSGNSRKPKTAPDITNAMAFPSLSDSKNTNPSAGAWGGRRKVVEEKGFESVKHGATRNYTDEYAPPKLSTANRFQALSDRS